MKFTIGQITFFVICLLVAGFLDFYLGARFGPELFWGIRVDRLNRESLLPEETSSAELEALLAEEADKLTFHQVLENTAPSLNIVPTQEKKGEAAKEEAKKTGSKEEKKGEKKEEQATQPETPALEAAKPEPARFTLQVGSFYDSEQALGVKKAFVARGYSSFITEVKIAGKGKWYRVHVGQFGSEAEALKNQGIINKNYKIMPLVVKLDR